MLRPLVLAASAALPAQGGACPPALGGGVEIAYSDGSVSRIGAAGPGLVREQVLHGGGTGFEVVAYGGIYVLRSVELDGFGEVAGTEEEVTFAELPPPPEPGQRVEGLLAQVRWMGMEFSRRHDLVAGALDSAIVAGCPYPAYRAELTLTEPEQAMVMRFVVVPALGTALLVALEDESGTEAYEPLSIAPLPAPAVASN